MSTGSVEPEPAPDGVVTTAPKSYRPPGESRPEPAWKIRGTRKPLTWFDRTKFLLLFTGLFYLLVWNEYLKIEPLGSWGDATTQVGASQRWLVVLTALELVRQLHMRISESSARYHRFWTEKVFGRFNRYTERRFSSWTRFRFRRVLMWVFWILVIALVLGKALNTSPVAALFQAPALVWQALPFIVQIVFILAISVLQFVAIFWFLSRGGVDTYFPDDIETRFSDVWGQDHVLERIKENVTLLEKPEEIEDRGGHVPSGILLWGPPGTGKTLIAEAVAGETGKPFVFVDPGAFRAMFFGVGVLKVKGLFRKLRKLALRYGGVIVFFDEADTLGSRGGAASPQPGYGMTAGMTAPWESGCHGMAHLSASGRTAIFEHRAALAAPEPARRGLSRFVVPGGMNGAGMGNFDGTLQALLTELSGLKKPRGFVNRVVRRALGMRPKPPPKYRILVMLATNLPSALDPALLRPGRVDRIYRVGYPSKDGRVRTYQGYLDKVNHNLTPEQVEKIATMTPYFSGAQIKDLVNEALIYAIREERETITWRDVIKAKQLKQLGPSEDVEYIERERHAVAVHEACHAVLAWKTRRHLEIDLATIEKGSTYLGMVESVKIEDQFTQWRSEFESDILVSLASLAGERLFYEGDNSSGVSGDLESATFIAGLMEAHWGMGAGIASMAALEQLKIGPGAPEQRPRKGGSIGFGGTLPDKAPEDPAHNAMGQRIEQTLFRLYQDAEDTLRQHRAQVLALAHALESHKTLTGEDVVAVLEGVPGPLVDGRPYTEPSFIAELERYHSAAVEAHRHHTKMHTPLPLAPTGPIVAGELAADSEPGFLWATPGGNGKGAPAPISADAPTEAKPNEPAAKDPAAKDAAAKDPAAKDTAAGNGAAGPGSTGDGADGGTENGAHGAKPGDSVSHEELET